MGSYQLSPKFYPSKWIRLVVDYFVPVWVLKQLHDMMLVHKSL